MGVWLPVAWLPVSLATSFTGYQFNFTGCQFRWLPVAWLPVSLATSYWLPVAWLAVSLAASFAG
jgi:hypothetical protein